MADRIAQLEKALTDLIDLAEEAVQRLDHWDGQMVGREALDAAILVMKK